MICLWSDGIRLTKTTSRYHVGMSQRSISNSARPRTPLMESLDRKRERHLTSNVKWAKRGRDQVMSQQHWGSATLLEMMFDNWGMLGLCHYANWFLCMVVVAQFVAPPADTSKFGDQPIFTLKRRFERQNGGNMWTLYDIIVPVGVTSPRDYQWKCELTLQTDGFPNHFGMSRARHFWQSVLVGTSDHAWRNDHRIWGQNQKRKAPKARRRWCIVVLCWGSLCCIACSSDTMMLLHDHECYEGHVAIIQRLCMQVKHVQSIIWRSCEDVVNDA